MSDEGTRVFAEHRELLFSIVYNLLGVVADTEDVLQDTWLAWAPKAAEEDASGERRIVSPRAYLVRIAVNTALARRESIVRRRETYVGPWLPEPLATSSADDTGDAAGPALRAESVSLAMLVVLETLTPLERAVFVLHEVFGYAHPEIAEIIGRTPAAVRQLAHRAREHVQARRPRFPADPRTQRRVTEQFLTASLGGDLEGLLSMLAPDVTLWTDGGGRVGQALRPVHGRENVAGLLTSVTRTRPPELEIRYREVNGDPSAVLFSADEPFAAMVLDIDGDRITGVYAVTNPDKLTHVGDG
ncbi:RNA polymerase sigma factor SigJ [Actinocorallia longicatena]|uniref:RNA polymerase sigma-70 factor n=1 Tax=Actinocorallia longicatena TaxID=111803 RepID=A0ABP6QPH0_9ACTN